MNKEDTLKLLEEFPSINTDLLLLQNYILLNPDKISYDLIDQINYLKFLSQTINTCLNLLLQEETFIIQNRLFKNKTWPEIEILFVNVGDK